MAFMYVWPCRDDLIISLCISYFGILLVLGWRTPIIKRARVAAPECHWVNVIRIRPDFRSSTFRFPLSPEPPYLLLHIGRCLVDS